MSSGKKLTTKQINKIIEVYKDTKSFYATAKQLKLNYLTVRKYLKAPCSAQKRDPGQDNTHIDNKYNNIDIYNKDNTGKDNIANNKENICKKDKKVLTNNISTKPNTISDNLDSYYLGRINVVTKKLFKSLNKKIEEVTPSKIPLSIAILLDKRNQILTRDISRLNMSRAIFNFFIDSSKVGNLIREIKEDKASCANVIDVKEVGG